MQLSGNQVRLNVDLIQNVGIFDDMNSRDVMSSGQFALSTHILNNWYVCNRPPFLGQDQRRNRRQEGIGSDSSTSNIIHHASYAGRNRFMTTKLQAGRSC